MIQVNISGRNNSVLNRIPVEFDEAVARFDRLVTDDYSYTVDPAYPPQGKKYNFNKEDEREAFFLDSNGKNRIYVIATTKNTTNSFTRQNKDKYNKLLDSKINPLLGKWLKSILNPRGNGTSRITHIEMDTTYAETNADVERAKSIGCEEYGQEAIYEIYFDEKTKKYRGNVILCH